MLNAAARQVPMRTRPPVVVQVAEDWGVSTTVPAELGGAIVPKSRSAVLTIDPCVMIAAPTRATARFGAPWAAAGTSIIAANTAQPTARIQRAPPVVGRSGGKIPGPMPSS